jgi:hypothetical protein
MDSVLKFVEGRIDENSSARVIFKLGIAWRNYTGWHIRGDERQPFLRKVANYYRRANLKAPIELPLIASAEDVQLGGPLGQIDIAAELGSILVNESLIRDLDEAEPLLLFVWDNTLDYEPCFCALAELYYKRRNYQEAARVALASHARAVASAEWNYSAPPAPRTIAG